MIPYMICPLNLTERQLLIYQKLYSKCNFEDMTVKYTTNQLSADIKIMDLDRYIINREIREMAKKGYLEVIYRGKRESPSIYKIIKVNEIDCTYSAPNLHIKCTLKPSDGEGLKGISAPNLHTKCTYSAHPIKEKEKDINIYSSNLENDTEQIWRSYPNKKGKVKAFKYISKILKKISKEELLRCIRRYESYVKKEREGKFPGLNYMHGSTFFNEGYIDYLDENYQEAKAQKNYEEITT